MRLSLDINEFISGLIISDIHTRYLISFFFCRHYGMKIHYMFLTEIKAVRFHAAKDIAICIIWIIHICG